MSWAWGNWPYGVLLGFWVCVAGLGGCAMCGACYDDCYPGYLGSCEGTACRGPRAGSIRAMGPVLEEEISPAEMARQNAPPSGSPEPNGMASLPSQSSKEAEGSRWANRAAGPASAVSPPASRSFPQGKPFSTHGGQRAGRSAWPPGPSAPYPSHMPPAAGPFSLLSHWWPQPPQTLPGQQAPYPQTGPSGGTRGYPASGQGMAMMARNSSAGTTSSSGPARNGPPTGGGPQGGLSQKLPMVSPNQAVAGQVGQPGIRMAQTPRFSQHFSAPGSSGQPASGTSRTAVGPIPPDVWAAIPPEDRPTAQLLSITDRKAEPPRNPPETSPISAPQPTSQSSSTANPSNLEWLPPAPLPSGSGVP